MKPKVLALASTVIWALFRILNLRSSGDTVRNLAESFLLCFLCLVIYGIITGKITSICSLDIHGVIGSVYIGLTISEVGNLIYLTPFVALVFIGSVVGEKIGLWTIAGLLLVIGGIVLQEMGKRKYQ